jgi:1,2-phenylacetyl-CoA epoxidase catalytic subunit
MSRATFTDRVDSQGFVKMPAEFQDLLVPSSPSRRTVRSVAHMCTGKHRTNEEARAEDIKEVSATLEKMGLTVPDETSDRRHL